jgi:vacuolar protein sorting-associated protein IST1
MGRRLDVLLGRTTKQTARLKSLLGLAVTRLGVVRGHRQVRCGQARGDVEQLLRLGHTDRALARAEHVVREQNALDVLAELEAYCTLIVERAALVDAHRECPEELREAAAGLVYAAARCGDLPELQEVRGILAAKFGREFVSAASNLRSGCGINAKVRAGGGDLRTLAGRLLNLRILTRLVF